jgi:hypothetical protein
VPWPAAEPRHSGLHAVGNVGFAIVSKQPLPSPYVEQLLAELDTIEAAYVQLLENSSIRNIDPNRGGNSGIFFAGYPTYGWAPSDEAQQSARMALLARVRDFRPRFELLFPHPTPEVAKRHEEALDHLEGWLDREHGDHSVPPTIPAAQTALSTSIEVLRSAKGLLPADEFAVRVVVDSNVLLDDPNLARFTDQLGDRYMAHIFPVVFREIDDHKRGGRTETLRESAKRADRRLKGLRDNGEVSTGAKVAGDVWAVFEHLEPKADGLPSWLELDVPDDRFVASALLLQSRRPGSMVVAATSDLNLQNKLAAVRLPFIEPT